MGAGFRVSIGLVRVRVIGLRSTLDSRDRRTGSLRSEAYGQKRERKAANRIGIVFGAFVLLVYPRIILILYHFAAPETAVSRQACFWIRILLYSTELGGKYAWRHACTPGDTKSTNKNSRRLFASAGDLVCVTNGCIWCKRYSFNKTFSTTTLGSRNIELPNDGVGITKRRPPKRELLVIHCTLANKCRRVLFSPAFT